MQGWRDGLAEGLEMQGCYFSSTLVVTALSSGGKGGASGAAVRALFLQTPYLAIQSSYGRSDSGFEQYRRGCAAARERGTVVVQGRGRRAVRAE